MSKIKAEQIPSLKSYTVCSHDLYSLGSPDSPIPAPPRESSRELTWRMNLKINWGCSDHLLFFISWEWVCAQGVKISPCSLWAQDSPIPPLPGPPPPTWGESGVPCGWGSALLVAGWVCLCNGGIIKKPMRTKIWTTFSTSLPSVLKTDSLAPMFLLLISQLAQNSSEGERCYLLCPFKIPTKRSGELMLRSDQRRDFPRSLVVKTLSLPCRGCRFDPWLGNQDPTCLMAKK